MSRLAIAIAATALLPFAASGEEKTLHSEYSASVSTYKPLQGFSHVVGERHFVGYYIVSSNGCAVTVINATAGDERLLETPRRQKFDLPAGGRTEIKADHGKALAVACNADGAAITVAALEPGVGPSASW